MKGINKWLKNHFGFSQTEIYGFWGVWSLMLLLLALPLLAKWLSPISNYSAQQYAADTALLNKTIAQIETNYKRDSSKRFDYQTDRLVEAQTNTQTPIQLPENLSIFNPNKLTIDQWKAFGLKPYIAQNIDKYLKKNGKFRVKNDLQKIYGFPPDLFAKLKPYIDLPDSLAKDNKLGTMQNPDKQDYTPKYEKKKTDIQAFDLNKADTAQLKQLRGIGTVLAERIVKFREKLGGFHSTEQLSEVYGIKPEVLDQIKPLLLIGENSWQKININTADFNTLNKHPYIGYQAAKTILNYRKEHGNFKKSEDLLKTQALDQTKLDQLKPYLVTD